MGELLFRLQNKEDTNSQLIQKQSFVIVRQTKLSDYDTRDRSLMKTLAYSTSSRVMPSFFILECNVVGGTFNNSAAPPAPRIRPSHFFNTAIIWSRSFSSIVLIGPSNACTTGNLRFVAGRAISSMMLPFVSNTLRSIIFSSSRILPGQW
jgi:hypothetical protein